MSNERIPQLKDYSEASLAQAFAALEAEARSAAATFANSEAVENFRLAWLGRKQGLLNEVSSAAGSRPRLPKPKRLLASALMRSKTLSKRCSIRPRRRTPVSDAALAAEAIDITLPGTRRLTGAEHPITRTLNEIVSVFAALGYSVGVGPEVETDFYNFECMNFPPGHPARDTQDTLVIANQERRPQRDRLLLRTHTSPVQMRTMESQPPPVRIVIPGKVHRNDAARRHPLADLPSGRRPLRRHQHHLQRPQGHARPRHEGPVRLLGQDALFPVVLPVHRALGRRADQLHLLWRQGLPQVQALRLDRAARLRHG